MTDKPEVATKKSATTKVPAGGKEAVKPVAKLAAKKPVKATQNLIAKKPKKPKVKVVRDFSMPQAEYQKIAEIKEACLKAGLRVKKSDVLRAGLKALGKMDDAQLKRVIAELGKIKASRPKKP